MTPILASVVSNFLGRNGHTRSVYSSTRVRGYGRWTTGYEAKGQGDGSVRVEFVTGSGAFYADTAKKDADHAEALAKMAELLSQRYNVVKRTDFYANTFLVVTAKTEAEKAAEKPVRVRPPHASSVIRFIKSELGLPQANMPQHGGFAVTKTVWDMEPVLFVHWAYAEDNMRARVLTDEVRQLAETLKKRGYLIHSLREDRNFFFIVPEKLRDLADH
jgi:hypothetical protein